MNHSFQVRMQSITQRQLEHLKVIYKLNDKRPMLKSCPNLLIKAICKCIANIKDGYFPMKQNEKERLIKYKVILRKLSMKNISIHIKRKFLIKEGNNFLSVVLQISIKELSSKLNESSTLDIEDNFLSEPELLMKNILMKPELSFNSKSQALMKIISSYTKNVPSSKSDASTNTEIYNSQKDENQHAIDKDSYNMISVINKEEDDRPKKKDNEFFKLIQIDTHELRKNDENQVNIDYSSNALFNSVKDNNERKEEMQMKEKNMEENANIIMEIATLAPISSYNIINNIINFITLHKDKISWNQSRELLINDNAIPRTNIVHLVNDLLRSTKRAVRGRDIFFSTLKELNFPMEYVKNNFLK